MTISQDQIFAAALGVDLDMSSGHWHLNAGGGLKTITGLDRLCQLIDHVMLTAPGSFLYRPEAGVGITAFRNLPLGRADVRAVLEERIRRNVPLIQEIKRVVQIYTLDRITGQDSEAYGGIRIGLIAETVAAPVRYDRDFASLSGPVAGGLVYV